MQNGILHTEQPHLVLGVGAQCSLALHLSGLRDKLLDAALKNLKYRVIFWRACPVTS